MIETPVFKMNIYLKWNFERYIDRTIRLWLDVLSFGESFVYFLPAYLTSIAGLETAQLRSSFRHSVRSSACP